MLRPLQRGILPPAPTSFPSPQPGSEGREGVLVQCDLPAPLWQGRLLAGGRWLERGQRLPWHCSSRPGRPVRARVHCSAQPLAGSRLLACVLRSWRFNSETGGRWGRKPVLLAFLRLRFSGSPVSLCVCLSGSLSVFPCCFQPFQPKGFQGRSWIACREAQLGNHTGISQSIHPPKSLLISLPSPACLASVLLCLSLNLCLCQISSGVTLPVFKSWSYWVTLASNL